MKRTMNKRDVAKMGKMLGVGVSLEKIGKALKVEAATIKRFAPKGAGKKPAADKAEKE